MKRAALAIIGLLGAALTAAGPAKAAEVFGGVYAHDINLGITACCYEAGTDVQAGIRSGPLVSIPRFGDLRVYALGTVNTSGGTDFAAAGVAWRFHFGEHLYVQPGIGAAVQDGEDDNFQRRPDRLDLGGRFLFEPELSLGYRVSPKWAVEASYVHLSHAQLAGPQNPGLDELGVRVVYRIGH